MKSLRFYGVGLFYNEVAPSSHDIGVFRSVFRLVTLGHPGPEARITLHM